jgi:hypothetical protein
MELTRVLQALCGAQWVSTSHVLGAVCLYSHIPVCLYSHIPGTAFRGILVCEVDDRLVEWPLSVLAGKKRCKNCVMGT